MSKSFEALGVSAPVVRALAQRNITEPFSVQALALPDGLAGRDLLVQSPTGSGKTLAFGIPIVERLSTGKRPAALVLVPTRELALQVATDLQPIATVKKLRVAAVYGGTGVGPQATRARAADILIATPGRLNDLLARRLVGLDGVGVLVLDEADRMLDMGFQPQVDRIVAAVPRNRQTMLFSATLDGAVAGIAEAYTNDPVRVRAELPAERGLALVFVRTKHGADKLAKKLARLDVPAVAMHGNLSQNARERALARFESGRVSTLVATDVAARGLDVDDVTHVINFDPPRADEDYVHRVGRTGRAGRSGTGVTFVLPEQQSDVAKLARRLGHHDAFAASGMRSTSTAPPRRRRRRR
jgi:ATP-dependent RNA helicase RhlE